MLLEQLQVPLLQTNLTTLTVNQVPAITIHKVPILINVVMTYISINLHVEIIKGYSLLLPFPPLMANSYLYSNIIGDKLDRMALGRKDCSKMIKEVHF